MKKLTLGLCLAAVIAAPVSAQTCKPNSIPVSHPEGQYLDNGDGTVTDIVNALMWSKCSIGQTYSDGGCVGNPTHYITWGEALQAAEDNQSFADHNDWRLPNIKELGSLVERSCVAPAISLEDFPSTPSAVYWTNTLDSTGLNSIMNSQGQATAIKGRLIDFTNGTEFLTDVNRHRLVRMVRDLD